LLSFGSDTLRNTNTYDNDVFVISVNADLSSSWLQQYESVGVIKPGYQITNWKWVRPYKDYCRRFWSKRAKK
jgi:hypothetical protein